MGHLAKFDIEARVRGSFESKFGKNYLKLSKEYNLEKSALVKRVFADADHIITDRRVRMSEALKQEAEAKKELMRLKTGE